MAIFGFGKKKEKETCGCATEVAKTVNENGEEMAPCDCGNMCPVSEIEAKKAEKASGCCCGDIDANSVAKAKENMANGASVKVLGPGCKNCINLEKATKEALNILNMNSDIEHVTDFAAISAYGVMSTPALVVDGKVVSFGKVLKTNEVVDVIKKARGI